MMKELTDVCSKYKTPLKDGDAVITPAFNMKNAKAIIHAVGPNFGVTPTAFKKFVSDYPDYEIDVKLCAFTASEMSRAEKECGTTKIIV